MAIKRHITHIKSNDVIDGSPKLPQVSDLFYGEIAINYADGYETMVIKNDADEMATYSSDEYWQNKVDEMPSSAIYDSDDKKIYFKNENDEVLSSMTIDATDFVIDGMIDSVELESESGTTYLVITWNTAAGKEQTRLDVGDIFEVDNYYTKDEIDEVTSSTTETIAAALVYLNEVKSDVSAVTEHTNDSTIHITAQEREKWNNAGYTEVTYSDLKTLMDSSGLTKGSFYRITDYVTTTTQEDTQSAGHQFDVVVFATDVDKLNENAYAVQHQGDTYFANSDLDAWELKYSLDNDTTKFAWADSTNGKGVIYYMKDELDNECPYDFKNIQFKVGAKWQAGTVADVFYYTFSVVSGTNDATVMDHSLNGFYCYGNRIGKWITNSTQGLNFNVFRNTSTTNFCNSNTFGNNCNSNTFGDSCYYNSFNGNCGSNTLGNNNYHNSFSNSCNSNTFGYRCSRNTFGNGCFGNSFGDYFGSNSFGDSCVSNSFGNDCSSNSFGNTCNYNSFGNYFQYNSFGDCFLNNSFGNYCYYNSFGNSCQHITFSKDNCFYNIVENGNQYITLTSTQTTGGSAKLQNITIAQGVNNTTTMKTISHDTVNDAFKTTYQPSQSRIVDL